jgi:hypothetical protein
MKDLNSFEDRYLFHRKDIQAATSAWGRVTELKLNEMSNDRYRCGLK